MIRLLTAISILATAAAAQNAAELLAKAHTAFVENREHDRYWTWTTTTNRSIVDRDGKVLQTIPSVTVESPIRSDGKRCNAVLAWGDGKEPYLANATADQRCTVEAEQPSLFRIEALLQTRHVRVESIRPDRITLAISEDRSTAESDDPVVRCIGAMKGTIQLDPATFHPVHIAITAATAGCERKNQISTDHYTGETLEHTVSGHRKGTVLEYDYGLQHDKSGDRGKDYWIVARQQTIRPWEKSPAGMLIWGRRFQIDVTGSGHRLIANSATTAAELTAESLVKFDTGK